MDLYEALQAGTSAEELLTKFNEQLAAAQEKIEEEKNKEKTKEKEENLAWYRRDVADALIEYIYELLEQEPSEEEIDEAQAIIIKALAEFEEDMEQYKALKKIFKIKSKENIYKLKKCSEDTEIISDFIKNAFK